MVDPKSACRVCEPAHCYIAPIRSTARNGMKMHKMKMQTSPTAFAMVGLGVAREEAQSRLLKGGTGHLVEGNPRESGWIRPATPPGLGWRAEELEPYLS